MRIAVLGAGGIGGYFGGRLVGGGHQVSFLARGAHLQAIRENGLQVESVRGDFVVPDAVAIDDPGQVGPVDLVLLAVKTWQLDDAIGLLPPLLGPHTAVLTTQNGVEAPDQVAGVVGRPSVLPGIAKIFAMIAAPGRIRHGGGPASLSFAEWEDVPSARVEELREAFTAAGIATLPRTASGRSCGRSSSSSSHSAASEPPWTQPSANCGTHLPTGSCSRTPCARSRWLEVEMSGGFSITTYTK